MTKHLYNGQVQVLDHPFVVDRLTKMREKTTPNADFRAHLKTIANFLAYEALADTALDHRVIETPLQLSKQPTLPESAPALISVLRAGNYMVDGALRLSPHSPIGMVGLQRNAETLEPEQYFLKLPDDLDHRLTLICDPMLATGGSLCRAIELVQNAGAKSMRILCLLAAPEGD